MKSTRPQLEDFVRAIAWHAGREAILATECLRQIKNAGVARREAAIAPVSKTAERFAKCSAGSRQKIRTLRILPQCDWLPHVKEGAACERSYRASLPEAKTAKMRIICGWCGGKLGTKPCVPSMADEVSHGICPKCAKGVLSDMPEPELAATH